MDGYDFSKNSYFQLNDKNYKVEIINPDDTIVVICIETSQISTYDKQKLLFEYSSGNLNFRNHDRNEINLVTRPVNDLDIKTQIEVGRRIKYIQALKNYCCGKNTILEIKEIINIISGEINDSKPPSIATVYRWINKFNISQEDSRSLIPRYDKRGPRHSYQDPIILKIFETAVNDAFNISPLTNVEQIKILLEKKIIEENNLRQNNQKLKMPSHSTCHRLFKKMDKYKVECLKHGKNKTLREFRLVGNGAESNQIMERYEIDHTPLDIFVIDEKSSLPLGRPWLTMIIDHFSRMPVGYHISFTSPSTESIFYCLKHAILPKNLNALQELEIKNKWPCFGIPQTLVTDNGLEFHGLSFEMILLSLDIQLILCPKHQPQFKGSIERFLKTINYQFTHLLPGTSFSKYHLRGDYNPEKHAILNFNELKAMTEKWIVDIYSQTVHRTLGVTPFSRWIEGLKKIKPKLPINLEIFKQSFGIPAKRSLRKDGILLHGLRYSGRGLERLINKYGPGVELTVVYDPNNIGEIRVFEPDVNDNFEIAYATNFEYANGLSLYQNKNIQQQMRDAGKETSNEEELMKEKIKIITWIQENLQNKKHSTRRKAYRMKNDEYKVKPTHNKINEKFKTEKKPNKFDLKKEEDVIPMTTFKFDRNSK